MTLIPSVIVIQQIIKVTRWIVLPLLIKSLHKFGCFEGIFQRAKFTGFPWHDLAWVRQTCFLLWTPKFSNYSPTTKQTKQNQFWCWIILYLQERYWTHLQSYSFQMQIVSERTIWLGHVTLAEVRIKENYKRSYTINLRVGARLN